MSDAWGDEGSLDSLGSLDPFSSEDESEDQSQDGSAANTWNLLDEESLDFELDTRRSDIIRGRSITNKPVLISDAA